MRYKAHNAQSYASEMKSWQRSYQGDWSDSRSKSAAQAAAPVVKSDDAVLKHLKWFLIDHVLIDATNRYYYITDVTMHNINSGTWWDKEYRFLLKLHTGQNAYVDLRLDDKTKLEDKYDYMIEYLMASFKLKSAKNLTEYEKVLYL